MNTCSNKRNEYMLKQKKLIHAQTKEMNTCSNKRNEYMLNTKEMLKQKK